MNVSIRMAGKWTRWIRYGISVLTLGAGLAHAQFAPRPVYVNFNNALVPGFPDLSQQIFICDTPVPTEGFAVQLYYGLAGTAVDQLVSVTNAPIGFPVAGIFSGSTRFLTGIDVTGPGQGPLVTLQVRFWATALGASWEEAVAAGMGIRGASPAFTLRAGNAYNNPPDVPPQLIGFRSFATTGPCIPEPYLSRLALVALVVFGFAHRVRRHSAGSRTTRWNR